MSHSVKEIIFLKPAFVEKIWGNQKLKQQFNFDFPENILIGEAWLISGLEQGMSYVLNGEFQGYSLKQLYQDQPQLFGFPTEKEYPLLTKILDVSDNLSVQIHPDDKYAKKHHLSYGKTECWYVLDCSSGQKVVYGHHAQTKEQLMQWLDENKFDQLLNYLTIAKDQFIYVPSLKIHGLLANTLVFELQQSSDITYRLYDYNRVDKSGDSRDLHLKEAKDIIVCPDQNSSEANGHDDYLVDNQFFKLVKIANQDKQSYHFPEAKWLQVSVLKGQGTIDTTNIKLGDSFILVNGYNSFELQGEMLVMLSYC
ncbi:type I phosphomannose isomerase catalytic subunit [Spiroplasma platyhelix]|uniref:Phosphohexomutase n=1 Tax=Spiroplasma platyhelix PALS-1 TaxID=1276218 RepID=A0A846TW45_9MOLU|nr:type I phosphomannose isomerase catalytic subunit [Spiroplasma platyhelix]MBE4703828.1 putative mannose-6-phosphate isomerase GmuF [Spiroplasma platyhelix PALS-1]NKE38201.1 mannose-6-phosphate isomerase [Spiroplasma platyhelix PALS-1]UJB29086.1 mannose-6-phosphate isomerase [Spiroplasma platyhelix PALS-1]